MAVSFSADGIHWEEPIVWPKYTARGDSHNFVFRDRRDGKYKVITRIWRNNLRLSALSESTDFINWSEPKEVLRGWGWESQVYSMPVFPMGDMYLGLASMFHEGDRTAPDFDTVDCELTYATKLDVFDFVDPGASFIPRGEGHYPDGEFDCCCIYSAVPVEIDGKLCFYYMGGNGQHTNYRETSFGRAFLEKDKFAYMSQRNPENPGKLVSAIEFATETLSGIPSIIFGLFGSMFFGETLGLGYSLLTGSLTLILMVLPLLTRNTQEALKTVPDSYRSGALGLGAGKWYMIRTVLLPSATPGILTGAILAIGRIVGESAALLFTAGSAKALPKTFAKLLEKIFHSGGTLTIQLYLSATADGDFTTAFGIAVVLLVLVLCINLTAKKLASKLDPTRRK